MPNMSPSPPIRAGWEKDVLRNLLGWKIAGCARRVPRFGRLGHYGELPQAKLLDAGPQFDLRVPEHPRVDPRELSALGLRVDAEKPEEKWLVVCGCGLRHGCPWTELAQHASLDLGIAVDRGLLQLSFYDQHHADCGDRHAHRPGIYHLDPKAWNTAPRAFLEATRHPDSAHASPVSGDGVEHAKPSTHQAGCQGHSAHPPHVPAPLFSRASVRTPNHKERTS